MSRMRATALVQNYKWARKNLSNPKLLGEADETLLDITDGHEILYIINLIMETKDTFSSAEGQKIERLIHECSTGNRSQKYIKEFIEANY